MSRLGGGAGAAGAVGRLSPTELVQLLECDKALQLLDVREPDEFAFASIAGSHHIPLGELVSRVGELDPERPTVCICHHGVRSARAAFWLATQQFTQLWNLTGGIDRWSLEVDPRVPRYG